MSKQESTLRPVEEGVLRLLPIGADRAIPASEIASLVGIETRAVHSIIADLCIEHGVPIVSTRSGERKGVFIAASEEEKHRALAEFESQVHENMKRINAVKRASVERWKVTHSMQRDVTQNVAGPGNEQLDLLSQV